ncbi:MAG: hypothetical protein JWO24_3026 [Rhodospirillales bacterium]|nr:hypothetical protein [Rhodospirillales bacterium]
MKIFWTCFVIDSLVFLVLFYFFLDGLGDGKVSSSNIALWLLFISIPMAVLLGGCASRRSDEPARQSFCLQHWLYQAGLPAAACC